MGGGDPAGGSGELARLIDRYGEYILADFQQYYRIDLADVLRPGSGLSARRALALLRQLPIESATVAQLRGGPEFRGWGITQYLLADLVDAVQFNTHAFISANSKKKPKPPQPFDRPESRAKRKRGSNSFAAMAMRRISAVAKRKKGVDHDGEGPGD
ncbi:Hypothetical protein AJAP_28145 [Amycolatopsis japonica]|uniref:Uncharacterized protein n=1 Tax=Amycolatopsis japonica TaxID=208439 RepID=A0A075UWB0_9PSEU|nr:hypothetical protein [Amycolatopsis japonica]AIG78467.1 Hypothetical protein AJAP_28145 [Amycolatopsis japonica]